MAWANQRNKEVEKRMEREFLRTDQDRIRRLEMVQSLQTDTDLSAEERAVAAEHEYEQSLCTAPSSSSNVPMGNANMPTAQRTATRHNSGFIHSLKPYINVPPPFLRKNWRPSAEEEASFGTVGLGAIGESSGARQSTKSAQPAASSAAAANSSRELLSGSAEDVPSTYTAVPLQPPRPSSTTSSVVTAIYRPSQPQTAVGVYTSPEVSSSNASSSGLPQSESAAISQVPTSEPQTIEDALAASAASSVTLVCTPVTPVQSSSNCTPPAQASTSTSPPSPTHDVEVRTMRLYQNLRTTYDDYHRWHDSIKIPEYQDALAQNCSSVIDRFLEEFMSKKYASRWDLEADFVAERTLHSLMYRRWSATQSKLAEAASLVFEEAEEDGTPKVTAKEADTPNNLSKEDLKHRRSLQSIFFLRLALHEELRTALFQLRNYFNELAYVDFALYVEKLEEVKKKRLEQERLEQERLQQERQKRENKKRKEETRNSEHLVGGSSGLNQVFERMQLVGNWRGDEYTTAYTAYTHTSRNDDGQAEETEEDGRGNAIQHERNDYDDRVFD